MEQYELDLQEIADFLNDNKDRFMGGIYSGYNFYVEDNVFMAFHSDIIDKVEDGKLFSLDSRQFCMELAKLIYEDEKSWIPYGNIEEGTDDFYYEWEVTVQGWSTLTNEQVANEAAEAIRQIKNNTLA